MKKNQLTLLAAVATILAACSPQTYSIYLDVRQPSSSGLDLSRKSISILYMDGQNAVDSTFDRHTASAMARALEADYFGGEEKVGLYRIPSADSVSVELMRSLVMETGDDVVFLLSSKLGDATPDANQEVPGASNPDSAYVCPVSIPVRTRLCVYDSMGGDDVRRFKGSAVMRPVVYNSGALTQESLKTLAYHSLDEQADVMGERISGRFLSSWQRESFTFYFFEDMNGSQWVKALDYATEGKFSPAIDIWGRLTASGSNIKRACACYNIALAFYLLEDMTLASSWLDECDKLENVPLSAGLRKRIEKSLEKFQK